MGIFGFHRTKSITPSAAAAPIGGSPTIRSIYQNRHNFGVNFGSLFVQEKFIYDKFFVDDTQYELDAIKKYIKEKGADQTRADLENHWVNYCSESDWKWLQSIGVTSIRIPIGYWHYDASLMDFSSTSKVYSNAWNILIEHFILKASQYHISIVVDVHALPLGANTGDHSGQKFDMPGFWSDKSTQDLICGVLAKMAGELRQFENVAGLQIVNESVFDNDAEGQRRYYRKAANAIRESNNEIPIIISDGWWPDQWVKYVNEFGGGATGLVIDTHIYRCFGDDDKGKSAPQIISELDSSVLTNLSGEADFMIGEYSCVLDGDTWAKTNGDRGSLVREYGNAELRAFRERAGFGSYFWCFKFEHGDGGEWGFVPMVTQGCIPTRKTSPDVPNEEDFNNALNGALQGHTNYWNSQNPNEKWEHWRFQEGFTTAWADCKEFAKFDNSKLGRVVAWKYARRQEHIRNRGESGFLWEWDQGFQQAVDYFKNRG